jgi:hypothetical protein
VNVLLVLVVIALVVVVIVLYQRQQQEKKKAGGLRTDVDPMRAGQRGVDVRSLSPGAVVGFEGRDWVVRGTIAFQQSGFTWHEHHLDDATTRRWLSVEDDEELEVCLWEGVDAPELTPGAPRLDHDGVSYALDERGTASYRSYGTTGTPPEGQMEFVDYTAGDKRLSFERYAGDTWEVSLGRVLAPREFDVYPAPRDGS